MKAVIYKAYGPPEVMRFKEIEKPVPKDDEVLIKIYATSVTAGDCEVRAFKFPLLFWVPLRLMFGIFRPKNPLLGMEMAGLVEKVGKKVTQFKPGDLVCATTGEHFGTYAEYKSLSINHAMAIKPAGISFAQAATLPTGGLNALHYLRLGQIKKGDKILINGAGGNFGSFAVQLAKYFGAHVTAVDSPQKLDLLHSIGADRVIDYTREDFTKENEFYDVIFDVASKASYSGCINSLSPDGRLVIASPKFYQMVRGWLTERLSQKKVFYRFCRDLQEDLAYLCQLIEAGHIIPVVDRIYPLDRVIEAHHYVESGEKRGNVALLVRDDKAEGSHD